MNYTFDKSTYFLKNTIIINDGNKSHLREFQFPICFLPLVNIRITYSTH